MSYRLLHRISCILILLCCTLFTQWAQAISVSKMTCEYGTKPLAIDVPQPRFGWQLISGTGGDYQQAYAIEVKKVSEGVWVWESGTVQTNQSQHILYEGKALQAGASYQWRVRVWDAEHKASAWSDWAYFRMAASTTNPQWIGAIRTDSAKIPAGERFYSREMRTPAYRNTWSQIDSLSRKSILLRKTAVFDKPIREAYVQVCGLGHYELSTNGKKVGDSEFAPLWTDYDKTVYYNTFDITSYLKQGENAFGIILGNGFYNEQGGRYVKLRISFGAPTLWLKAVVEYTDGSRDSLETDGSWKYDLSPITFNDMYGGEDYDARLEQKGWDSPGFNDNSWLPVVLQDAPKGELIPQQTEPVKIMERYRPVSSSILTQAELDSASILSKRTIDPSARVFDMGQNLAGFPEIKVKGKKGQVITLFVSEALTPQGACDQRQTGRPHYYRYTLKGEKEEIWHPRFSYYGYRYIQVEGAVQKGEKNPHKLPVLLDLQSCFVYNSVARTSTFQTSSDLFNKTHQLIEKAVNSNMQAVFTDCPHREKLGWLEQLHLNGPGLLYNLNLTRLIPKIMSDMADAQQANGMIPTTAPLYNIFGTSETGFDEFGDSPEWSSSFLILPHMYEKAYGDSTLLVQYYPAMRRYVEYLISRAVDNQLNYGLGDWYDYGDFKAGYSRNTPVPLVATAYYFYDLQLMAALAERIGNHYDGKYFKGKAAAVRETFNRTWFNPDTGLYASGSQAAQSIPLYLGITEAPYRQVVLDNLVKDIEKHGNRLTTGDVGNRYLFQTLADNGLNELMFTMHHHYDTPGYGFQLLFGATTLTEQWDPRRGSSWNHFMMGQIDEWFFKSLAGISPITPGYQHFLIQPEMVGDLTEVDASIETLYGKIAVSWKRNAKNIRIFVAVPVNCTASLKLPDDTVVDLSSGSHEIKHRL